MFSSKNAATYKELLACLRDLSQGDLTPVDKARAAQIRTRITNAIIGAIAGFNQLNNPKISETGAELHRSGLEKLPTDKLFYIGIRIADIGDMAASHGPGSKLVKGKMGRLNRDIGIMLRKAEAVSR